MRSKLIGAVVLVPSRAHACSPAVPGVDHTVPVDGGVHPTNAGVLIAGRVLDPEGIEAMVDGVPATVAIDPRSRLRHYWGWDSAGMSAEPAGCGCQARPAPSPAWCGLWLGLLLARRRRVRRAG